MLHVFTIDELYKADEIIVCASGCLFMGTNSINGRKVGGKAEKLLKSLQKCYEEEFIKQCGSFVED